MLDLLSCKAPRNRYAPAQTATSKACRMAAESAAPPITNIEAVERSRTARSLLSAAETFLPMTPRENAWITTVNTMSGRPHNQFRPQFPIDGSILCFDQL